MVHPAFDIKNDHLENRPANCRLLIDVSEQSFNYILFTRSPEQLFLLRQYRIYTTGDRSARDVLEEIISGDEILQQYSGKATIIYNFPDSNILPEEYFQPELKNAVTRLIYGNTDNDFIFDELVHDWNMHNVYTVPKDLHSLCREKFKEGQYWHIYTIILNWSKKLEMKEGSFTRVLFYNDKFVAAFFKDGQLQLLQTFAYQTPEDAAYYLLLICRQFNIAASDMELQISGLIDTQSALYTELLKYFSNVSYEGVPETYGTNGLLEEYPPHYFSPLLKMSLCV